MSFYDPGDPYTFTWGTSEWGASGAVWSTPGVYRQEASVTAAGSATVTSDEAVIETSGAAAATSAAEAQTGSAVYVDPTGTGIWVTATTARLWERLPACYRDADATASGQGASSTSTGFPLLRWLACLVDQAGYIEGLIDRFASAATSDLVNPETADAAWLPWLAQMVGVNLPSPVPNIPAARAAIAEAITGTPKGSKGSIVAAVEQVLTGAGIVTVTDHYDSDPWTIQVDTPAAVTPSTVPGWQPVTWGAGKWGSMEWGDPDPIAWYLDEQGLRPAGFSFTHTTTS